MATALQNVLRSGGRKWESSFYKSRRPSLSTLDDAWGRLTGQAAGLSPYRTGTWWNPDPLLDDEVDADFTGGDLADFLKSTTQARDAWDDSEMTDVGSYGGPWQGTDYLDQFASGSLGVPEANMFFDTAANQATPGRANRLAEMFGQNAGQTFGQTVGGAAPATALPDTGNQDAGFWRKAGAGAMEVYDKSGLDTVLETLGKWGSSTAGGLTALGGFDQQMADGRRDVARGGGAAILAELGKTLTPGGDPDYVGPVESFLDSGDFNELIDREATKRRVLTPWGEENADYGWGRTDALHTDGDDPFWERAAKAVPAFVGDVASDPLSWFTAGTVGGGRKATTELVSTGIEAGLKKGAIGGVDDALRADANLVRQMAKSANRGSLVDDAAASWAKKAAGQDATGVMGRAGQAMDLDGLVAAADPADLLPLAHAGIANQAAAAFARGGPSGLRSWAVKSGLPEDMGKGLWNFAFEELPHAVRRPRVEVPVWAKAGFNLTRDSDGLLTRALNADTMLNSVSQGVRTGARKGTPTLGKFGGEWNRAVIEAVDPNGVGFGRSMGLWTDGKKAARLTYTDTKDLSQRHRTAASRVLNLSREAGGKAERRQVEEATSALVNARGRDLDAVKETLSATMSEDIVSRGEESAQIMFDTWDTIGRDLFEAHGGDVNKSMRFLNQYLPRIQTSSEAARRAAAGIDKVKGKLSRGGKSTKTSDAMKKRTGVFVRFEPNPDKPGLRLERFLTPAEIAEETGREVFEADAHEMFLLSLQNVEKVLSNNIVARNLRRAGLMTRSKNLDQFTFDANTRAAVVEPAVVRAQQAADLLGQVDRAGDEFDAAVAGSGVSLARSGADPLPVRTSETGDIYVGKARYRTSEQISPAGRERLARRVLAAKADRPGAAEGLPPAPGTANIPEGAVRAYHYTGGDDDLASILEDGIDIGRAKGAASEEPDWVWAMGNQPGADRNYVEFWTMPDEIVNGSASGNMAFGKSIPAERIVSSHAPWQDHARYAAEEGLDPQTLRDVGTEEYTRAADFLEAVAAAADDADVERAIRIVGPDGQVSWANSADEAMEQAVQVEQGAADALTRFSQKEAVLGKLVDDQDTLAWLASDEAVPTDPDKLNEYFEALSSTVARYSPLNADAVKEKVISRRKIESALTQSLKHDGWEEFGGTTLASGGPRSEMDRLAREYGNLAPAEVVQALKYRLEPPDEGSVLAFWDGLTALFKVQATTGRGPGYVARNIVGGAQNAMLVGARAGDWRDATRSILASGRARKAAEQRVTDLPEAERLGKLPSDFVEEELTREFKSTFGKSANRHLKDYRLYSGIESAAQSRAMESFWGVTGGGWNTYSGARLSSRKFLRDHSETEQRLARFAEQGHLGDDPSLATSQGLASRVADTRWVRFWNRQAVDSEELLRLAAFKSGMREFSGGQLGDEFAAVLSDLRVKQSQFDYGDLSEFERKVLKRVIPFWTWSRNNVPLQVRALMTHPRYARKLVELHDAMESVFDPDDEGVATEDMPGWMQERRMVDTGWRPPFAPEGASMALGVESPFNDLTELFGQGPGSTFDGAVSAIHPAASALVEGKTGIDLFTGAPFPEKEAPPWWAANLPGLTRPKLGGGRVGNPQALNVPRTLMPWLGQIDRLVSPAVRAAGLNPSDTPLEDDRYLQRIGSSLGSSVVGAPVGTLNELQLDAMATGERYDLKDFMTARGVSDGVAWDIAEVAPDDVSPRELWQWVDEQYRSGVPLSDIPAMLGGG